LYVPPGFGVSPADGDDAGSLLPPQAPRASAPTTTTALASGRMRQPFFSLFKVPSWIDLM